MFHMTQTPRGYIGSLERTMQNSTLRKELLQNTSSEYLIHLWIVTKYFLLFKEMFIWEYKEVRFLQKNHNRNSNTSYDFQYTTAWSKFAYYSTDVWNIL